MSEVWIPRIYQERKIEFGLEHPKFADWADMGLGKTASTLQLINILLERNSRKKFLVVAPKRVAYRSWPMEMAKWCNFDHIDRRTIGAADFGLGSEIVEPAIMDEDGTIWVKPKYGRHKIVDPHGVRKHLMSLKEPVHFVSYDFFVWLVKMLGNRWPYDGFVIDESTFVKKKDTVRWRACNHVKQHSETLVQLTGTPSPKGVVDLWAQVYLLDGGKRLGRTQGVFREAYLTPIVGQGGVVYGWAPRSQQAKEEIREKVSDIAISMRTEDYLTLPERVDNIISVELPPRARQQYDLLEATSLVRLKDSAIVAANKGVMVGKLLQIANGVVYDDEGHPQHVHDAKLDALEELVESTPGNLLVGIGYKPDRERILKRFPFAKPIGGRGVLDAWDRGEVKMMVAHPAEGAHGLNIQEGGDTVVWYGQQFSLELYMQFNKRLHRYGSSADRVVVNHLVAADTIDEDVVQALQDRHDEQELLLEAVRCRLSAKRN